ncbi:MAG: hypothetical protein CMB77_01005 [Euryarchaeota archaeon]|nr:hypothetical protein [Euryarchaeota archaeon]
MRRTTLFVLGCLVFASFVTGQSEETDEQASIITHWFDGWHVYEIIDLPSNDWNWSIAATINGAPANITGWNETAPTLFNLSEPLIFGDVVDIIIDGNDETDQTMQITRSLDVVAWNEPGVPHEVAFTSEIWVEQYGDNGRFDLSFNASGWQIRDANGELLREEGGSGRMIVSEPSGDQSLMFELELDDVWRNLTSSAGIVTFEGYEFSGSGNMLGDIGAFDDGARLNGTVHDARWVRYWDEGSVTEQFNISASGEISTDGEKVNEASAESDEDQETNDGRQRGGEDGSMSATGEIARLSFGYVDQDGVREAQRLIVEGDLVIRIIDDDLRVTQYIDDFEFSEVIENTVIIDSSYVIDGYGFIDANIEEDGIIVIINATIHDLLQIERGGLTLADTLHYSGTYSGDVEGTFGQVRSIEDTLQDTNASGVAFEVNRIRDQRWNNITGGSIGQFAPIFGIEAYQNETITHDVRETGWNNRTIFIEWVQTGADPSEGSEKPERSPIPIENVDIESNSAFGEFDLRQARGLVPRVPQLGDTICLSEIDTRHMCITFGIIDTETVAGIPGIEVIHWTGPYMTGGNAEGATIRNGPLTGLIAHETHIQSLGLTETIFEQHTLIAVLNPSIVSSEQNTAPVIGDLSLRDGLFNDGRLGNIDVDVFDAERNVEYVEIHSEDLDIIHLAMNDRGIDGDRLSVDGTWSVSVQLDVDQRGIFSGVITAVDVFGVTTTSLVDIILTEAAPTLDSVTFNLTEIDRGEEVTITIIATDEAGVASVEVDFTEVRGNLISATKRISDGAWVAMVTIPEGVIPGHFSPLIRLIDSHGAMSVVRSPVSLVVNNDAPRITDLSLSQYVIDRSEPSQVELVILRVTVTDPDGILLAQVMLADLGNDSGWQPLDVLDTKNGTYGANIPVRDGLPGGEYPIVVRFVDVNSAQSTSTITLMIVNPDDQSVVAGVSQETASSIVWALIGTGIIALAAAAIIIVPRITPTDDEEDTTFE